MKEKIKLIVLIVVFIAAIIITNNLLKNNNEPVQKNWENEIDNTATSIEGNVTTSVISSYNENTAAGFFPDIVEEEKTGEVFEVTEENFTEMVLKSDKKVLIEFYADWCGPCKTLSPILEEIAKENLDIKVVKINVDESPNLATTFGANSIPYLVVMEDAREINFAIGALPKNKILELVK